MITLTINHEENDYQDLADYLRTIATSLESGNTSGNDWDTEGEETDVLECEYCGQPYLENESDSNNPAMFCSGGCEETYHAEGGTKDCADS